MTDERLIERAIAATKSCLLPPLTRNMDTQPIAKQDFNEFRIALDDQLHLLLDILYQNGDLLQVQAFDNQLTQLRSSLLLLVCEQTEPNTFFQTDQKILIASLEKILSDNLVNFDDLVLRNVVETYKELLKKDSWKRQLGTVHGFPKFCEIVMGNRPGFVNADLIMFMLSVGSNLISHYEPHYKTIGLKIYRNIVEKGNKNLLKELNIHQVIYVESFPLLQKSNEIDYNDNLYDILICAVAIENTEVIDSKWCKFDDLMDVILTQIGMESDGEVFRLLLRKLVKLSAISYEINEDWNQINIELSLDELKEKSRSVNCRTLRWTKKLMQLIIRESSKLLIDAAESYRILHLFHAIYIISFSNIDSINLGKQLEDFTKKFLMILMQVAQTFKQDQKIIHSIILFLETIAEHQRTNQKLNECLLKILDELKLF